MKWLLIWQFVFFGVSSTVYAYHQDEKWFSRICVSIFCVGVLYLGEKINELKSTKEQLFRHTIYDR